MTDIYLARAGVERLQSFGYGAHTEAERAKTLFRCVTSKNRGATMSDPHISGTPPTADAYQPPSPQDGYAPVNGYNQQPYPPQGYAQPPYTPPGAIVPADQGLSDTAAGALAYITIIPAIVFLVLAPYNTRPFVKFHAFQCIGIAVLGVCLSVIAIVPILGWIVFIVGWLAMLVIWVMSLVKASQGSYLNLPVISKFASQQSGYPIA